MKPVEIFSLLRKALRGYRGPLNFNGDLLDFKRSFVNRESIFSYQGVRFLDVRNGDCLFFKTLDEELNSLYVSPSSLVKSKHSKKEVYRLCSVDEFDKYVNIIVCIAVQKVKDECSTDESSGYVKIHLFNRAKRDLLKSIGILSDDDLMALSPEDIVWKIATTRQRKPFIVSSKTLINLHLEVKSAQVGKQQHFLAMGCNVDFESSDFLVKLFSEGGHYNMDNEFYYFAYHKAYRGMGRDFIPRSQFLRATLNSMA